MCQLVVIFVVMEWNVVGKSTEQLVNLGSHGARQLKWYMFGYLCVCMSRHCSFKKVDD